MPLELQVGWERSVGPRCAWGMDGSGFWGRCVFFWFSLCLVVWWWFSLRFSVCLFGGGLGVCRFFFFFFSLYHDLKPNTYAALK